VGDDGDVTDVHGFSVVSCGPVAGHQRDRRQAAVGAVTARRNLPVPDTRGAIPKNRPGRMRAGHLHALRRNITKNGEKTMTIGQLMFLLTAPGACASRSAVKPRRRCAIGPAISGYRARRRSIKPTRHKLAGQFANSECNVITLLRSRFSGDQTGRRTPNASVKAPGKTGNRPLTVLRNLQYRDGRWFPQGIKRECGEDRVRSDSAAAPATVSGEPFAKCHWASRLGRRRRARTREPGDLPSVVVTRERIGRGVLVGVEPRPFGCGKALACGDVPR
jgi:hypothetical protein